ILARQVIVNILRDHSNHQTIGIGSELEEAIKKISLIEPDVVLLNLESENPNTSTIFRDLKEQFPSLPVIVLTPRTQAGARLAIKALAMGAADFITKPKHSNTMLFAGNHLRKRLVP